MRRFSLLLTFAPAALVLLGVALLLGIAPDAPFVAQAARGYPYVALLAATLLAWRLERVRLFVAGATLAVAYVVLQPALLGLNVLAQSLFATFLPIGIALLSFPSDSGFTLRRVRNLTALAFAPLLAAAFFTAGSGVRATAAVTHRFVDPMYSDWSGLPQTALVVAIIVLVITGVRAARSQRASDAGLAALSFGLIASFGAPAASSARGVWVLAAALVLIIALVETAYAMAFHDELTGLPARRALAQCLHSLEAPYAIALVDVDKFKSFNDRHGHDVGDQVLRMVAARLGAVAGSGKAYRSGGEEFVIVFPQSTKREALEHVEDVRASVAAAKFALRTLPRPSAKDAADARGKTATAKEQLQVTVSVGVAESGAGKSAEDVMKAADKAMYRAKQDGRNRVVA